jgi:bacterioferritin (cytochrome b1)
MSDAQTIQVLNRLLTLEYRSLPMYLCDATPWTNAGDEKATATLAHIVIDQKAMAARLAEMILDLGGTVETGEYPMEYTDTHFLSLDYLLKEILQYQQIVVREIEFLVDRLSADRRARDLALEVLGSERAHLESLEALIRSGADAKGLEVQG